MHLNRTRTSLIAALAGISLLAIGCTNSDNKNEGASASSSQSSTQASASTTGHDHADAGDATELAAPQPRLVATYDGGILTLNAETLEVIDDTPLPGFLRINSAGDGRHSLISVSDGFRLFDAGVWTEDHGDHTHSYATNPKLTDTVYEGDKPGHTVNHAGKTILFSDNDGKIQIFTASDFLKKQAPTPEVKKALEPHHGVAVVLKNGNLVHTLGTSEKRVGAIAFDSTGKEIARSEECPGVHGEGTAEGDIVSFGCTDGVLLYKGGKFTKVSAVDSHGRTGTQIGSEHSPVILGSYAITNWDEHEPANKVALVNTVAEKQTLVELPTYYSYSSLARGPKGEALVLGTDGKLYVINPDSAQISASYQVVDKWEEPEDWKAPRPRIYVQDGRAYITDPAANQVHIIEISTGKELKKATVPKTINELSGVSG